MAKKPVSAPANINPFASAPEAPKVAKPSKAKRERVAVELGDKLDRLAAFKVFHKLIDGEAKILEAEVREDVIARFAETACSTKSRPESFIGTGERATASCEIRRRGSNMPISDEVRADLDHLGIPYDTLDKVPERFIINPEIDQDTLAHLAKIVQTDPKLKGKTIVMKQSQEATHVVSEATIDGLASVTTPETCKALLEKVATFAIGKFNFDGAAIEGGDKNVTPEAKAIALSLLQEMGVLPSPEIVKVAAKKRA